MIKIFFLALALVAFPSVSSAASYAFVHTNGNVNMVTASSWSEAIRLAPGISTHSGVILLNSPADQNLVGDSVSGA